jgi:hypothetical protein
MAKLRTIPNPTGKPLPTGPVQIGDQCGWFIRCDEIGRPLPRLLRYAALNLEIAHAYTGDTCQLGRAPSYAMQLRVLAECLGPDYPMGYQRDVLRDVLHHTSLAVTKQYAATSNETPA